MPLFSRLDLGSPKPLSLADYKPDLWESIKAGFAEGWSYNPSVAIYNSSILNADAANGDPASGPITDADLVSASQEIDDLQGIGDALEIIGAARQPVESAALDMQEQGKIIEEAGFAGQIEPHPNYDREALDLLIANRRAENTRKQITANAPAWHFPFSLAASFAAGAVDPINIASAFIPVIGEQRLASMLASASGAWGRAGVRAISGAASGAVGGAVLEPLVASGQIELQKDYSFYNSLLNVSFGAVLGGAVGPVAGKVSEWRNSRRGIVNDFEYLPQSEESISLMREQAQAIADARLGANPNLDPEQVRLESLANAMQYDRQMRHLAFGSKKGIAETYRQNAARISNGEQYRQAARQLEGELAVMRRQLADYEAGAQMAADYPDLRFASFEDELARSREQVASLETRAARARELAEKDWAEMVGGNSLYMGRYGAPASMDSVARIQDGTSRLAGSGTPDGPGGSPGRPDLQDGRSRTEDLFRSVGSKSDNTISDIENIVRDDLLQASPENLQPDPDKSVFQLSPDMQIMGAYTPGNNPLIRIFASHDQTTMPRELSHHMLKLMERQALAPDASPLFRERYRKLMARYGVAPDGGWTRSQQEAFADDFMNRFMLGHNDPSAEVAAIFSHMREYILDQYESADALGLPISAQARRLLDGVLTTPMNEGRARFTEALADINTRNWEREFVTDADLGPARALPPDTDSPARLERLSGDASAQFDNLLALHESERPELAQALREEAALERQEFQRQRQVLDEQESLMDQMVACYLN